MLLFIMKCIYFLKKKLEMYKFKAYNEILGSFLIFIHKFEDDMHTIFILSALECKFLFIFPPALHEKIVFLWTSENLCP
jgi:hypothetical protein